MKVRVVTLNKNMSQLQ